MGIDHVVGLDCAPKHRLGGVEGLVNLLKSRSRADAVVAMARRNGDTRPVEQITFQVAVQRPTGVEVADVTVAELYTQAAALEPQRASCLTCPANARNSAGFGCARFVPYPVPLAAEQWLWARLPTGPETTAGMMLQSAVHEYGWDGAPIANMRAQGDTFFESRQPLRTRWSNGFTFSSDQLFHLMFMVGTIGPSHALMIALFTGALPHDVPPAVLGDARERTKLLAAVDIGWDNPMAGFLRACVDSAGLNVDLLVDG